MIKILRKILSIMLILAFSVSDVSVYAQQIAVLPPAGSRLALSLAFVPPLLKGIKIFRNDPFRFDFILDKGDTTQTNEQLNTESNRLIKYFLAALTVPEQDLWVNLSPYEKDRIVPEDFGKTEMGRDLLAQDYILKQITASVIYPEGQVGKEFWDKVYAEALKRYGTTNIPVDTFNKVWIVPSQATVYEDKDAAFVVESKLKVMLDSDYLAMSNHGLPAGEYIDSGSILLRTLSNDVPFNNEMTKDIIREIIIPILEEEVNEGQNFAILRQVYNAVILATWYKRKLKDSMIGQGYVDQNKTVGIDISDKNEKEKIWQQYVAAFKMGVYSYIKEEVEPATQEIIPRKYFSGGTNLSLSGDAAQAFKIQQPGKAAKPTITERDLLINADFAPGLNKQVIAARLAQLQKIINKKKETITKEEANYLFEMTQIFGNDLYKMYGDNYKDVQTLHDVAVTLYLLATADKYPAQSKVSTKKVIDTNGYSFLADEVSHIFDDLEYLSNALQYANQLPKQKVDVGKILSEDLKLYLDEKKAWLNILDKWSINQLDQNVLVELIPLLNSYINKSKIARTKVVKYFKDHRETVEARIYDAFIAKSTKANKMYTHIKSHLNLIKNDIALGQEKTLHVVDINQIIEFAAKPFYFKDNIKLTLSLAKDIPKIEANFLQFSYVFLNLLKNAYTAIENASGQTPDITGFINVTSETVFNQFGEMSIKVTVSDNGLGISNDMRKNDLLFEKGESSTIAGKGMGLYTSQLTIAALNGTLTTEDFEVNGKVQGANFVIEIPVSLEKEAYKEVVINTKNKKREELIPIVTAVGSLTNTVSSLNNPTQINAAVYSSFSSDLDDFINSYSYTKYKTKMSSFWDLISRMNEGSMFINHLHTLFYKSLDAGVFNESDILLWQKAIEKRAELLRAEIQEWDKIYPDITAYLKKNDTALSLPAIRQRLDQLMTAWDYKIRLMSQSYLSHKSVDLKAIVKKAVQEEKFKNVVVVQNLKSSLTIEGDENALISMVNSLVTHEYIIASNILKDKKVAPAITVSVGSQLSKAVITITSNAPAIAEDKLDVILDPFQIPDFYLTEAKLVAIGHGGEIQVSNKDGKTTFIVSLPLPSMSKILEQLAQVPTSSGYTEDPAMTVLSQIVSEIPGPNKGGIDLNAEKLDINTKNNGESIAFNVDPVLLSQLRNSLGLTPVIINISPLSSFNQFLGTDK